MIDAMRGMDEGVRNIVFGNGAKCARRTIAVMIARVGRKRNVMKMTDAGHEMQAVMMAGLVSVTGARMTMIIVVMSVVMMTAMKMIADAKEAEMMGVIIELRKTTAAMSVGSMTAMMIGDRQVHDGRSGPDLVAEEKPPEQNPMDC